MYTATHMNLTRFHYKSNLSMIAWEEQMKKQ